VIEEVVVATSTEAMVMAVAVGCLVAKIYLTKSYNTRWSKEDHKKILLQCFNFLF
jgi:hypothetical protein